MGRMFRLTAELALGWTTAVVQSVDELTDQFDNSLLRYHMRTESGARVWMQISSVNTSYGHEFLRACGVDVTTGEFDIDSPIGSTVRVRIGTRKWQDRTMRVPVEFSTGTEDSAPTKSEPDTSAPQPPTADDIPY